MVAPHPVAPDRGQAIPMLLLCVALVAAVSIGFAAWGVRLVHREQARAAADAASLAGVVAGRDAAAAIAEAHGASLVDWRVVSGGDVEVTVEVGAPPVRAVARASVAP